jgi:hypothetical protein
MARKGGVNADTLREFARRGAEEALRQLRAEIVAIERTFPELKLPHHRRELRRSLGDVKARTRHFSEAARKAISERMTKYWAERRKAQSKVK